MNGRKAYIISKPLQYVNAVNIIERGILDCFIIDLFTDSFLFYKNVKELSNYWNEVHYFKRVDEAYSYLITNKHMYDTLYTDNDQGFKMFLYHAILKPIDINVYEEGFGTYRLLRDNSCFVNRFKNSLYKIFNTKNWFGGGCFTKSIYVYHPNVFKCLISDIKPVLQFHKPFLERFMELLELRYLYSQINFDKYKNRNVLVYLGTWPERKDIELSLINYNHFFKIYKGHPHIKDKIVHIEGFDEVLKSDTIAEIILLLIMNVCNELVVLHDNSTALIYLKGDYTDINLGEGKARYEYEIIRKLIKKDC